MDCLDKVRVTNSGYLRVCHDCNGCLDTLAELPTENVEKDMIYFIRETELYYSWDGTNWNPTGGEFELAGTGGGGGSTPTIGENGNWHIDGEDTGKPSRGEKGDPGEKGEPGPKGDPGATDASGVTFDNSNTWLEETNVQDAIENLDENIGQWFIDGYFNEWSYMASPSDTTGLPYVYSHSEVQNSISIWKDIVARSLNAFGLAVNKAFEEISKLINTKLNKNWIGVCNSGYLTTTWKTVSSESISSATEVMLMARWYGNALATLILPIAIFRGQNGDGNRAIIHTHLGEMEIKYVSDTQIQAKFNGTNQYINLYIFAR